MVKGVLVPTTLNFSLTAVKVPNICVLFTLLKHSGEVKVVCVPYLHFSLTVVKVVFVPYLHFSLTVVKVVFLLYLHLTLTVAKGVLVPTSL